MSSRPQLQPLLLIARGAEGSVWLAADPQLGRFVAVKIFRLAGDAVEAARHLAEELAPFARAAAASNVLPVLSAGRVTESNGRLDLFEEAKGGDAARSFYLEMPHVLGPNLREVVASAGALSDREVVALLGQLAPKLAGLHADGEAHLDLKPENVLVEASTGRVSITDFHLGTAAGTPGYAAPEQAASPGPACDVHALSRLLLELWTGRTGVAAVASEPPPFAGDGAEARAVHRELTSLLVQGLETDPAARPTAVEVAARAQNLTRRLGLGALEPEVRTALALWKPSQIFLAQQAAVERGIPEATGRPAEALVNAPLRKRILMWSVAPLALGILLAAAHLFERPDVNPAPPLKNFEEGVFSKEIAPRPGRAVRVDENDRVSMTSALFEMKVPFQAQSIAVLSRNDEILDQIDDPVPRRIYRWEVQPGIVGWSVRRKLTGLESRQVELGPHETKLVMPTREPEMAPAPEDAGPIKP